MTSFTSPALMRRLQAMARLWSRAAAALGLVGLLGWLAEVPTLRAFIDGRPVMTPRTSLGILLAALALHLSLRERTTPVERVVGFACAALTLAIGAVTIVNEAMGIEVGIDAILRRLGPTPASPPVVAGVPILGRPSLPTAACLVLVGGALLALDRPSRGRVHLAEWLAVGAMLVTHAVLTGHAYAAEALFRHAAAPTVGMALPTAIALALLAWGLLLARPVRGVTAVATSNLVGGMMARRLLLPAVAGPPLLGFVVLAFANGAPTSLSLSHAVLATSSAAVAAALTLWTAASLSRVDQVRREFEDELRRWRDVAESADEAIIAKTLDGIVTGWNRAAEQMFGWRRDEILGCSILTIVPEDRRAELAAYRDRIRRGEHAPLLETVRSRKDGTLVDVVVSLSPVKDREGRILGYSAIMRDITERKAAQAARRRLEQQYTELFEQASDGIFLADLEGRVTEVNAAGARLLGYSREELLGKSLFDLVPPEDRERLAAQREALLRGNAETADWRIRARDGQWIPVEVSAKFLPGGRWQGFVRDLRARLEAEAALARAHAAERDLRVQLEAMSRAATKIAEAVTQVSATDVDSLLQVVAREAQTLTHARYAALGIGTDPTRPFEHWVHEGMSREQEAAIGRRPRPVGLLGAVPRHARTIRVADISASAEHLGFPPGHPRMRSFLGTPVLYAGQILGHIYLADRRDADEFSADDQRALEFLAARAGTAFETARLYREEALARAWLFAVIDGMPEAVILADAAGRISYNVAAQYLVAGPQDAGAGPGTPRGLELRDPTGAPVAWSELPLVRALRAGETSTAIELLARNRDGLDVPLLASTSPLRDASGAIIGAVSVLRNITPLKEIERLREQWTAIVAHDLRQPLSVIAMSAQALARSGAAGSGATAEKALARIQSATDRLQRMINDLLDASRLDARQLTLEREAVDLGRLLSEVVARTDLGEERRIRLRVEWPLPRVWGDPDRLEQVMENLLSNAGKYGDPGSDVVVEARAADGEVVVSTRSRGPDLGPDEIAHLFTRFYRARGAPPAKGLGLGLYITRGLVEAHGGRIWVDSADRTTTFRFTLPRVPE